MSKIIDPTPSENAYVINPENAVEVARLMNQDILFTKAMGGLLAERPGFENIHNVLDIGCGPGRWGNEIAFAHPEIQVVGIDISPTMIGYARAQVTAQGLNNATFIVMDALKPLDFPDNSFDLVNARGIVGFMRPSEWPRLLQECFRIIRPGGVLRITNGDDLGKTNSASFEKLVTIYMQALELDGRCFTPNSRSLGITPVMSSMMRKAGFQHIKETAYILNYSAGTEAHASIYHDWMVGLRLLQPYMIKMKVITQDELDLLYPQAMAELLSNDFCGAIVYISSWCEKL